MVELKAIHRSTTSFGSSLKNIFIPTLRTEVVPEIILTVGNTDGFAKVLMALTNEWSEEKDWIRDKDGLLVERFGVHECHTGCKAKRVEHCACRA